MKEGKFTRRDFVKVSAATGAGIALTPILAKEKYLKRFDDKKPLTNIADALKHSRKEISMPGKFPAAVVKVDHKNSVIENKIISEAAHEMVEKGMLTLTGASTLTEAWRLFVDPNDKIGLKVNPVAGPTLSTSIEVTQAVVSQLVDAGIKRENLIIWDRRETQLAEAGFTAEAFPGIKIIGTEREGENGTFYDDEGKLYSEQMIDKDWYYWADVDGEYDEETMPWMVNGGKYSYFTKIATQMVDKIINIPVMKNAGSSVTLCMKNLAYGSITNTARLHQKLWSDTSAEVCAFPPLRDKVVLNIIDGIRGCFNGGPGAKPQFFTNYKTLLFGTDPVAVDRIGFDIITKKRIEEGLQKEESKRGLLFIEMAEELNLGTGKLDKIDLQKIELA